MIPIPGTLVLRGFSNTEGCRCPSLAFDEINQGYNIPLLSYLFSLLSKRHFCLAKLASLRRAIDDLAIVPNHFCHLLNFHVKTAFSSPQLNPQDLKIELAHRGAVSDAARNGEAVNVRAGVGGAAPSMLCMPVYGADGLVAGVVQVVGKKSNRKARDSG